MSDKCQCKPSCKRKPLKNSPFCAVHIKRCSRIAPLSGYEPNFDPDLYNKYNGIKEAQNCFAYAFDYKKLPKGCTKHNCDVPFTQPGSVSGYPKWADIDGKRCPDLVARLLGDIPNIKMSSFTKKCPKNYSKIALVIDPKEDYHFYRHDKNGLWSHKPGATNVTSVDATGRPIYDPQLASRKYIDSNLNYGEFCGYFCIPRNTKMNLGRGGTRKKRKRRTKGH